MVPLSCPTRGVDTELKLATDRSVASKPLCRAPSLRVTKRMGECGCHAEDTIAVTNLTAVKLENCCSTSKQVSGNTVHKLRHTRANTRSTHTHFAVQWMWGCGTALVSTLVFNELLRSQSKRRVMAVSRCQAIPCQPLAASTQLLVALPITTRSEPICLRQANGV